MTQGSTGPEPAFVIVTGSNKYSLLAFIWSTTEDLSMHWARMRLILPRRQHISHPTRRATHKLGDTRLRNDTTRHHTIQRRSDLLHGPFLSVCHRPARQGHPHSPHTAPQPPHAAPTLDAQGHTLYYLGVQRCDPLARGQRDSTVARHTTRQPLRQPGRGRVGGRVGAQRVLMPERRI